MKTNARSTATATVPCPVCGSPTSEGFDGRMEHEAVRLPSGNVALPTCQARTVAR